MTIQDVIIQSYTDDFLKLFVERRPQQLIQWEIYHDVDIVHLRHSKRAPPAPHLVQEGVDMARYLSDQYGFGEFDLVVTSPLPRAIETAVAMGYAPVHLEELLVDMGSIVDEVGYPAPFSEYRENYLGGGTVRTLGDRIADLIRGYGVDKILLVSHGGIVEASLLGLTSGQFSRNIDLFSYCEGFGISRGNVVIYRV